MKLNKILSVAALALGCVACEFDEYRNKVVKQRLREPIKGVCAVTADQERVIAASLYDEDLNLSRRIRCFDARSGRLIAVSPFELNGLWSLRAASPDFDDTDQFWTLHANGYRLKWTENFMLTAAEAPLAANLFPGVEARAYYDMDIASDGTVFLTVEDMQADGLDRTYLYRKAPGNQWERTTTNDGLMYKECRVSHDNLSGKTMVLVSGANEVVRFSGLNDIGRVGLQFAQHGYTDVAAAGGHITVSTRNLGPNGYGKLFVLDVITEEVTDEMVFGKPMALGMKAPLLSGQAAEVSVFVAGLDYFPGKYGLVELTLKKSGS